MLPVTLKSNFKNILLATALIAVAFLAFDRGCVNRKVGKLSREDNKLKIADSIIRLEIVETREEQKQAIIDSVLSAHHINEAKKATVEVERYEREGKITQEIQTQKTKERHEQIKKTTDISERLRMLERLNAEFNQQPQN